MLIGLKEVIFISGIFRALMGGEEFFIHNIFGYKCGQKRLIAVQI